MMRTWCPSFFGGGRVLWAIRPVPPGRRGSCGGDGPPTGPILTDSEQIGKENLGEIKNNLRREEGGFKNLQGSLDDRMTACVDEIKPNWREMQRRQNLIIKLQRGHLVMMR